MSSKRELRNAMLQKRTLLKKEEIDELSKSIVDKVMTIIPKGAKVGIFYPIKNEVDVRGIAGKLAFPKVIKEMAFYLSDGEFVRGKYNIPEPTGEKTEVDVLIVPGSVFDLKGYRIGYGGGYYDKYMKNHHLKIGVCFDFQVINEVPKEEHDVKLDWLVTEKQKIKF